MEEGQRAHCLSSGLASDALPEDDEEGEDCAVPTSEPPPLAEKARLTWLAVETTTGPGAAEVTRTRKLLSMGAAIVALGAGAMGVPAAAGGGSGEQIAGGPQAERAEQAALEVVGGGHVVGVERTDAGWKVNVVERGERLGPWWDETTSDSEVEVQLNRDFEWVRIGGSL